MNRFILSCFAAVALVLAPQAQAGLPSLAKPKLPGTGGGGGPTMSDIDNFIASALVSEVLARKSEVQLARAVLAKEILDPLEQRRAAAEAMTDGKEKQAALRKVDQDREAALAKVDYQKVSNEEAAKWDEEKKTNVRDALFNLALCSLVDIELVDSGRKLASGPPPADPAIATRIPLVNDTVSALGNQTKSLGKISGSTKTLTTVVKLDKLPTSASEKPREVKL
jgi:hypothetical protein